jgi:uncharacterized pyridoxamine 5'-phosphate oxidase family protein
MEKIADDIVYFLKQQEFVIVSTLEENNTIHCSAKGIVHIENDSIYLIDLYRGKTFTNLKHNREITITAVDGHKFKGYSLQGKGHILDKKKIDAKFIQAWEKKVINRISKRLLINLKKDRKQGHHPEARFPEPQYIILMQVEAIIDLAPQYLRKNFKKEV